MFRDVLRTLVNASKTVSVAVISAAVLSLPFLLSGHKDYLAGIFGITFISLAYMASCAGMRGAGVFQVGADIFDSAVRRIRNFGFSSTNTNMK